MEEGVVGEETSSAPTLAPIKRAARRKLTVFMMITKLRMDKFLSPRPLNTPRPEEGCSARERSYQYTREGNTHPNGHCIWGVDVG